MRTSRILSLVVSLAYVLIALLTGAGLGALKIAAFLILPLACIWLSDEMGGYVGWGMGRGAITSTSPGFAVAFCGWVLLLLPVIAFAVISLD